MIKHFDFVFSAPFLNLGILLQDEAVQTIEIIEYLPLKIPQTKFARQVDAQLAAYFTRSTHHFSLPLQPHGTPFQQRVWQILQTIPAGKVLTYGEVASQLNTSPRAVGNACRANPIPIIIPCHRVVARQSLGGYMGNVKFSLEYKRKLLQHEGYL